MNLRRLLCLVVLALPVALGLTQPALATGGNYVIVGGTGYEQQQVKAALAASSFNWSVVPGPVTINIAPGATSEAVPGAIFLEPSLLDSGQFSWGVVQHEYAHEVDFALLDAAAHARLNTQLGGAAWCYEDNPALAHNQYGCERFASTLAWSFWQSPANCMRPTAVSGESGGMAPAAFRALVTSMLGAGAQAVPAPASVTPRLAPKATRTVKLPKN